MPYCPTCNGRFEEGTFCPKDGTQLLPEGEQSKSLLGQVIAGRYRLTKLLGQGGMGEVYAAEHVHITKRVAVKVLHPEIGSNPEALARFKQEAQSASSIGHDNIVAIDDFGQMDDGRFYLCMEFLSGKSLAEAMQVPGGMDPQTALEIMIQVCNGLAAAHAKGIIHRDMKPENVFLTQRSDGTQVAKILDFGIAKVSGTDNNDNLTKTGTVFGTPHYMSPEQALGQKLDHRADVYSMGVMLFEIFTGQVPFKAESFMGILSQHITKPAPQPSTVTPGRSIARPIEDVILKAMAKEPDQRYGSIREMGQALSQVLDELRGVRPEVSAKPAAAKPAATMAFGSGSGLAAPAPAAAAMAGHATVTDESAGLAPPRVMAPTASDLSMQATMLPPSISGPQQAPQASGPGPQQTPQASGPIPFQTGPGPGAPTPIPKTMMASQMNQQPAAVAVSAGPAEAAPAIPVVASNWGKPPRAKKSNTGLIVGIVLGAVVVLGGGGAAAAYFLYFARQDLPVVAEGSGSTAPGTGTGTVAMAGSTENSGEHPTPDKPDKPVATPDKPDTPIHKPDRPITPPDKPRPPKKTIVDFRIVTVPSNARVRLNGRKTLGYTPLTIKLKPGQSMRVLLARGGYADTFITITGGEDDATQTIRLSRSIGIPGANPGGVPGAAPF